jgi:DNA-binding LytR/AlgR family response regulator
VRMPRGLRAVVADDEPGARAHLRALLESCPVHIVAECATGGEVLAAVPRLRPDVLCLDVRLPEPNGIAVARALAGSPRPVIMFITGYADYAAEAFDLDAADYLLKPLTVGRVTEALRRVSARLDRIHAEALARPSFVGPPPRLFIPAHDHHQAIAPEAIRFIEAGRGTALIHTDDGVHVVRASLSYLERALVPHGFLRTHRAYLVNVRRVRALVTWSRHAHTLLLDSGKETHVPVAKSRFAAFRRHVIWIAGTGGLRDGPWDQGPGGDRRRREPGSRPGDR